MTIDEQERLAYVSGDTEKAALLARIATLQRYLGEDTATLEAIAEGGMTAKQAAAQAAKVAAVEGTAKPMIAAGAMAYGGMGLAALDEQRKYIQEQAATGAINNAEYQAQLADLDRQEKIAQSVVSKYGFSANPDRSVTQGDNLYDTTMPDATLYSKEPTGGRLYAYGGEIDAESGNDDNYANRGLGTLSEGLHFAQGGEPRFLSGGGDGMSDSIRASIEGKQEARLADGEFVIPADVVSHLGNGSSKAGAKQLYSMMDKVRSARTGTKQQGKQINPRKFLAA
jgi:hypothetical protein